MNVNMTILDPVNPYTVLYKGKYISIVSKGNWEYVERNNSKGAVIIIPALLVDGVKHILLIREFRIPLNGYNISLPAGLVGDKEEGEDYHEAACRELLEETGYEPGRLRFLTKGSPSSGLSNETLVFYLADQLVKHSDKCGVEGEDITTHLISVNDIPKWLEDRRGMGDFIDPKVFMALYFVEKMEIENGTG